MKISVTIEISGYALAGLKKIKVDGEGAVSVSTAKHLAREGYLYLSGTTKKYELTKMGEMVIAASKSKK
jgi:hypothetical protein